MIHAMALFKQIDAQLYQQNKAPADEIEMQRERWYQDFTLKPDPE
jgi:hypothetical protein